MVLQDSRSLVFDVSVRISAHYQGSGTANRKDALNMARHMEGMRTGASHVDYCYANSKKVVLKGIFIGLRNSAWKICIKGKC